MSFSNPRELAQTRRDDMSNRTWHRQVPPSVCCGEKKAGGPIGTNSFGDSGFVVLWCVCETRNVQNGNCFGLFGTRALRALWILDFVVIWIFAW